MRFKEYLLLRETREYVAVKDNRGHFYILNKDQEEETLKRISEPFEKWNFVITGKPAKIEFVGNRPNQEELEHIWQAYFNRYDFNELPTSPWEKESEFIDPDVFDPNYWRRTHYQDVPTTNYRARNG